MSHPVIGSFFRPFFVVVALLLGSASVTAAVPQSVGYQGYVTDDIGAPIDGVTSVTFAIYGVDSGGAALWSDTLNVDIAQGLLTVELGRPGNPLPGGIFDAPRYLGIAVDVDAEMTPRQTFNAVGFALRAEDADTLEGLDANALNQSSHVSDTANPHGVTPVQIGAATEGAFNALQADVITAVTAGAGLMGGATAGDATLSIDPTQTQVRVTGSCPVGELIRGIKEDGAVACEVDNNTDTNAGTVCAAGQFLDGDGACITGALVRQFPTNNTASGVNALLNNAAGSNNTASGAGALQGNTDGNNNTASGANALLSNVAGSSNTASGAGALQNNTDGNNNTASGRGALQLNRTGFDNTASGRDALLSNTTGGSNTALGAFALRSNTTGSLNTASGRGALRSNTTGSFNTASGRGALESNTTGGSNTALGRYALQNNTTGGLNTASGVEALQSNTTGTLNTASGVFALRSNSTGSLNTASGASALQNNTTGNNNTASGAGALQSNTTGLNNTASGVNALLFNTTGDDNTASGVNALQSNTTGLNNTASGVNALESNTTGSGNTASGKDALLSNTTGSGITALGRDALRSNTTAFGGTALGSNALRDNTTGSRNTASGAGALENNTTGDNNAASGSLALQNNTTGSGNTAIGYLAGVLQTTGSSNIYIDNHGVAAESDTIRIGDFQTRTFIKGIRGRTTGFANAVSVVVDSFGQLGTISSSGRYKENIADLGVVSERLLALRPVQFRYKADVQTGKRPVEYGLIAEEVAEVMPELVVYDESGQPETVRYHVLSTLLLNELQTLKRQHKNELQALKEQQETDRATFTARLARVEVTQQSNARLAASIAEMKVTLKQLLSAASLNVARRD